MIVSDGDRVLQVISNLLSNAFRWTPDGGRIDLGLAAGNGTVRVDVADSGPGVPPEERERIFDPFISHDVNGTGLGLPIARELALALGGRIELQSEPGSGSRFRLVLPVVRLRRATLARYAAAACSSDRLDAATSARRPRPRSSALEPCVDAPPAGAHEVDEEREIVDAGVTLGEELALEALEPPDRLVEQAADLGDVPGDRQDLGAEAVADGNADLSRDRGLELGGGGRERLDLRPRALERRFEQRGSGAAGGRLGDSLLRPFQSQFVHGREATLSAGWTLRSSTTSSRRS